MRPSLVLLAALCAATLGIRIAGGDESPLPDEVRFQAELVERLQDQGFTASSRYHASFHLVEARRGDCTLSAVADVFYGSKEAGFVAIQPAGRELRIYYGGWVADFPRVRPVLAQYTTRYLDTFGISSSFAPVVLLASDPACDLSAIDLSGLRVHFSR